LTLWYSPRQILEGPNAGKWHYTTRSDDSSDPTAYPVGACAKACPGHADADGATLHYAEGVCAGEIRDRELELEQRCCFVCREFTTHVALLWEDLHADEVAICVGHDVRAALRVKYFTRRGLKP
jgi:hypothetical protein